MVTISSGEVFVFFGAVVLGAILSICANFVVSSAFTCYKKFFEDYASFVLLFSFVIFAVLVGLSLWYFISLANIDNNTQDVSISNSGMGTAFFLLTLPGNIIIDFSIIPLSIFCGIVGGLVANIISVKYTTNKQRANQLNENLHRCLTEIIQNRNVSLKETEIENQLTRINDIVDRKRRCRDLKEWPAFAKKRKPFSQSNIYQYLLVDNTRYFIFSNAMRYPKKPEKINEINALLELSEQFNFKIQEFERKILTEVNNLIQQNINERENYDTLVQNNHSRYREYITLFRQEFDSHYNSVEPENFKDLEVTVGLFNQELK